MRHLMLSVVLAALSALSSPRRTAAQPIYDTDGHEVSAAQPYYILPFDRRLGSGFDVASPRGSYPCPMRVVLHGDHSGPPQGIPVVIARAFGSPGPLRLSDDVEINFHNQRWMFNCAEVPKEWHLRRQDAVDFQWHVAAGRMDRLGPHPVASKVFRVERVAGVPWGYMLASCAGWPEDGQRCHGLGLHVDEYGNKWLVVSNTPYVVVFQKYTGVVPSELV